jgi:hypothetical protein
MLHQQEKNYDGGCCCCFKTKKAIVGFQDHRVMDDVVFSLAEYSCMWCSVLKIPCGFSFQIQRQGWWFHYISIRSCGFLFCFGLESHWFIWTTSNHMTEYGWIPACSSFCGYILSDNYYSNVVSGFS